MRSEWQPRVATPGLSRGLESAAPSVRKAKFRPDMSWRDGEPLVRYEEELARPALARPVLVKRTHTVAPQPPFSLPTRAPTANGLGERERDPAMFEAAALAAARTLASTPATLSTPTQSSGKVRKIPSCRRGGVQVTQGCIDIAVVHSATSDTPSPQPPSPSFVSANRWMITSLVSRQHAEGTHANITYHCWASACRSMRCFPRSLL
jgi:hypothetical protein